MFLICLHVPSIAQLAEHLTVEPNSYQMVPGSIPGRRMSVDNYFLSLGVGLGLNLSENI